MKPIDYESETSLKGTPKDAGTVKAVGASKPEQRVGDGAPAPVRKAQECRSITLEGCGDHSGKDINNSMSLSDAYCRVVLKRNPGESRWPLEPVKVEPKEILKIP